MGKKKEATMSIDSIISQISSLKDNSQSFITKDGDDEIWREDVRACESAIAILSALQDAGINEPDQIVDNLPAIIQGITEVIPQIISGRDFIKHRTPVKRKRMQCALIVTWVDKDSGEDQTLECIGVYKDYEKAYGAALLYLDEMAENDCDNQTGELMITTTIRLEGETGYGIYLRDKDGKDLYRTYILDVLEQEGSETDGSD